MGLLYLIIHSSLLSLKAICISSACIFNMCGKSSIDSLNVSAKLYVNIFLVKILWKRKENGKSNKCDIEHTMCFLEEVLYYLKWYKFYFKFYLKC